MDAGSTSEAIDPVFRALADPIRRQLLDRLIAHNGQTLRELCAGLEMARQSVSKHLAVLEAANLVTPVRRGREKLHYLNPAPIAEIADRWISRYHQQRVRALADLKHALEAQPMRRPEFVYTTYIKTTAEKLWQALTDPAFTKRYWEMCLPHRLAGRFFVHPGAERGTHSAQGSTSPGGGSPSASFLYLAHLQLRMGRGSGPPGRIQRRVRRQAGCRAALEGHFRDRAGRRYGEADRRPRRVRARERRARRHQPGLAPHPGGAEDPARNRSRTAAV